jgi:hypothetical protein
MSDFEDILQAPTQEAFESRVYAWTSRLLVKWRMTGLNELEGSRLMWVWTGQRVIGSGIRQLWRERRFEERGSPRSLQYAAIVFEKDVRTIRRWCEEGFFPGATRTKGHHWRIPPQVVNQVREQHPRGFGRGGRRLFRTKAWRRFKKDAQRLFGRDLMEASEIEAALRDRSQVEFFSDPVPPSSEAMDMFRIVRRTGQAGYAMLRNLARRLYKADPQRRVNYELLAEALHISPSTLYRRYTKKNVRAAIRAASKPLKHRADEIKEQADLVKPTEQESDMNYIAETFSDIEVDDVTSPYLTKHDPDDLEH